MISKANKEIIKSISLISIPIIALFTTAIIINQPQKENEPITAIETKEEIKLPEREINLPIEISAKAAYVKDLNTGQILFAKNENTNLPIASLTKIMTAVVAKRNGRDNQLVKISEKDVLTQGESFIYPEEVFNLKDLVDLTLVGSVNDTASAISSILNNQEYFISEMNRTAKQIGLENSEFKSETGLDINDTIPTATSNAKDIVQLIEYALKNYPDIFDATTKQSITVTSLNGITHTVENTNEIIGDLPGLLVSKTGFTDTAGGNLAVVIDKGLNEPIAIVVLGSPNTETRFQDVEKILETIKKSSN